MVLSRAAASLYEAPGLECPSLTQFSALLIKAFWLAAQRHLGLQRKCFLAGLTALMTGLAVIALVRGPLGLAVGILMLAIAGTCLFVMYVHKPARIENASIVYWPFYFRPYRDAVLIFDMRALLPPAELKQSIFRNAELSAIRKALQSAISMGLTSEGKIASISGLETVSKLLSEDLRVDRISAPLVRASERYVSALSRLFVVSPSRVPEASLRAVRTTGECDLLVKVIADWDAYVESSLELLSQVREDIEKTAGFFYGEIESRIGKLKEEFRTRVEQVNKLGEAVRAFFSQVIRKLEDEIRPQLDSLEFEMRGRMQDLQESLMIELTRLWRERVVGGRQLDVGKLSARVSIARELGRLENEIVEREKHVEELEEKLKKMEKEGLYYEIATLRRELEFGKKELEELKAREKRLREELDKIEMGLSSLEKDLLRFFEEHEREIRELYDRRLRRLREEREMRLSRLRRHIILIERDRDKLMDDLSKLRELMAEELARLLLPFITVREVLRGKERRALRAIEDMSHRLVEQRRAREAYHVRMKIGEPTVFYLPFWVIEIAERGLKRTYVLPPQVMKRPGEKAISWLRDYVEFSEPLDPSLDELARAFSSRPDALREAGRFSIFTKDLRAIMNGVREFVRRGFISSHFYKELARAVGVRP